MIIVASTLPSMKDSGHEFAKNFCELADFAYASAALTPTFSAARLEDAHGAWVKDLERVEAHEKNLNDGLDHFKQAGHLAFWLRRFAPITDAKCTLAGRSESPLESAWRAHLYAYPNEHVAFMLGFNICKFYQLYRIDAYDALKLKELKLDNEYIQMVCHFMKYKTVSPHALTVVYKSIFTLV